MIGQLATTAQLFEAVMLICFGLGWPVAILKTLRTRRTEGKSLGFLWLIFFGYLAGIVAKCARAHAAGEAIEWVIWLYAANILLVAADIALYLRYSRRSSPTPSV